MLKDAEPRFFFVQSPIQFAPTHVDPYVKLRFFSLASFSSILSSPAEKHVRLDLRKCHFLEHKIFESMV